MIAKSNDISHLNKTHFESAIIISHEKNADITAFIDMLSSIFHQVRLHIINPSPSQSHVLALLEVLTKLQADHLIINTSCLLPSDDIEHDKALLSGHLAPPLLFINEQASVLDEEIKHAYSNIHWHCDFEELKTRLTINAYKQGLKNTLVQENHLLQATISCVGNIVIYLDEQGRIVELNAKAKEILASSNQPDLMQPWYDFLLIKREFAASQLQQFIYAAIKTKAVTKIQPLVAKRINKDSVLLDGIISPISYSQAHNGVVLILRQLAKLDDLPVIYPKDNKQLTASNKHNAAALSLEDAHNCNVVLISPDKFKTINHEFSWETGNIILDEIEARIHSVIRPLDLNLRYSGASFLVFLYDTQAEQTHNLLGQLMSTLTQKGYGEQTIPLTFSFGLALNDEALAYSPVELFYFANFALSQAKELGGNQTRQWSEQNTLQQVGNFDRVNGCFKGKGTADYQKMLKFWIVLNQLGQFDNNEQYINALLAQLINRFELSHASYFKYAEQQFNCACHLSNESNINEDSQTENPFTRHQKRYLQQVANTTDDALPFTTILKHQGIIVMVPIKINGQLVGVLKLTSQDEYALALRDHSLLSKVANHVSLSFKNIEHTVSEAHGGQDHNPHYFWYSSSQMNQLIQEVNLVAPTNATVLITGESGTGKEMIATEIHQKSQRNKQAFIIFDCSTVVESLIESELFGHVKGAFTGANKASIGCIAKAEGGTLFLDEVGELPLHTQVKLLRFVQEKRYSPVGSHQYKQADVRVIAATNVDLEQQINSGLFRQDLYYRLNVFNIDSPPLRQRRSDILLIAEKYLQAYAKEYQKQISGFTPDATQAMLEYNWPGNIRELKNLIHRATIVCTEPTMACVHLGLYPSRVELSGASAQQECHEISHQNAIALPNDQQVVSSALGEQNDTAPWQELVTNYLVYSQLNKANKASNTDTLSLKSLLEKQLYQLALEQTQCITIKAAAKLNIAESTFRRRWQKLQLASFESAEIEAQALPLANSIYALDGYQSKITTMQYQLLDACLALDLSNKDAAKLFDVTLPTYRNLIRSRALSPSNA